MPQPTKPTTSFSPPPSSVLATVKNKDRPVGGVPPVKIPPLDAEPLEGGGSMSDQAAILQDPSSPLSPTYDPDLAPIAPPPRRGVRPDPATPYRPKLSPATVEGMEAVQEFQRAAEAVQAKAAAEVEAAAPDPAKASSDSIDELRTLFADDASWSVLNNPSRRRAIEARLKPLDIADLLFHGEIRQEVEIVPNKITVVFRSVTGEEDLGVKQLMGEESGTDRYLMDKFSLMGLALGIVSINGVDFPTHLNEKKRFDKELFKKKFERLLRMPLTLLADLGLQIYWFDKRVQSLFADQTVALKNS
jgi:hypothetical protein